MASTIRVGVHGLGELRRDLDAVSLGLSREVSLALKRAAETVLPTVKAFTPVGPGPEPNRQHPHDQLPHIRDTLAARSTGTVAQIVSDHPGAPVHEWGGTISPGGGAIRIAESAMAGRAGQAHIEDVERVMADGIDRLCARHNL
ncbi:MAG: hypothetical protein M3355_12095 [Actinomycetota bacterium]|nr:hypothetical protein [Actinomycetota bacterium]